MFYSKDEHLLEAPFPMICGISREMYIKTSLAFPDSTDRFVYDLDRAELSGSDEALKSLVMFRFKEKIAKLESFHSQYFNSAQSHCFELTTEGDIKDIRSEGLAEELSEEYEPSEEHVLDYFDMFESLWRDTLITPLLEVKQAVCRYLRREKVKRNVLPN